jgi:homoserine kinase type II
MEHHNHPILLALQKNSQQLFGFKLYSWEPISLGWLNLKWKLATDRGEFLLKVYHTQRFSDIDVLSRALQQQQRLYNTGFPSPELLTVKGEVLHRFHDLKFIIMRFCPGKIVKPKQMNKQQMYELGTVTGKMHRILNDSSIGVEITPQFIPQCRNERLFHWNNVIKDAKNNDKPHLISNIELQLRLTETIDIDSFGKSTAGWTHGDLWVDNLLFFDNKVSAVLDFDRLNFNYPELDVARAIMSWAFYNGILRTDFASAYLAGYRKENEYRNGI